MTCESCVKDISGSLHKLDGIQKVEASLKDQLVTIEGTGSSLLFDNLISVSSFVSRRNDAGWRQVVVVYFVLFCV